MNIRAACGDREITKPKQCWMPSGTGEGQSRVSPSDLRLHCSSRQDRLGSFIETEISQKMLAKTAMLMGMK